MKANELQNKINHLKQVMTQFSDTENPIIGVTIIRLNSSDNWLFNTEIEMEDIVPGIVSKLDNEIKQLEEQLIPLLEIEANEQAILDQEQAKKDEEEATRLEQEQKNADLISRMSRGEKAILRYLRENDEIEGVTLEQSQQLASGMGTLMTLLKAGSLTKSIQLISLLPDAFFLAGKIYESDKVRKQSFIDELS